MANESAEFPQKVLDVAAEIRELAEVEPEITAPKKEHWWLEFVLAPDDVNVRVRLEMRRTTSGRITNPAGYIVKEEGTTRVDWQNIVKRFRPTAEQGIVREIPPMPAARAVDDAPPEVKRLYYVVERSAPGSSVQLGFDGTSWAVGTDTRNCDCVPNAEPPCTHGYVLRFFFHRKGRVWKLDPSRFMAIVRGGNLTHAWRHMQPDRIMAQIPQHMAAGGNDEPSGPPQIPGRPSSAEASPQNVIYGKSPRMRI